MKKHNYQYKPTGCKPGKRCFICPLPECTCSPAVSVSPKEREMLACGEVERHSKITKSKKNVEGENQNVDSKR